jgi:hypothetical protein
VRAPSLLRARFSAPGALRECTPQRVLAAPADGRWKAGAPVKNALAAPRDL